MAVFAAALNRECMEMMHRRKRHPICSPARYAGTMSEHTGSSYDAIAAEYAEAQDRRPWNAYFERPGMIAFLPQDLRGREVLDAGCGPGFYTQWLAERGARVTAFDLNAEFVRRTRERVGEMARVLQADLAVPLEFAEDGSFDLVVCVLVLHYLKDWGPALAEFHRVLRPGGRLVFSTHHPFTDLELSATGDYFAVERLEDDWDVGKVEFYRRPMSRISRDLCEAGFVMEEIAEPQPVRPPADVEFGAYERAMKAPMRLLVRARRG